MVAGYARGIVVLISGAVLFDNGSMVTACKAIGRERLGTVCSALV